MAEHWVNLPKRNVHVADGVPRLNNLGDYRFVCRLKNGTLAAVQYSVEVVEGAGYTQGEEQRHDGFRVKLGRGTVTNEGEASATLTRFVTLPAAGGCKYKIKAKLNAKEVESPVIESRRRLYFQVIKMANVAPNVDYGALQTDFLGAADKLYVDLQKKGGDGTIPYRRLVSQGESAVKKALRTDAKGAYTLSSHDPYAFALVFVDMLAVKTELTQSYKVTVGNLPDQEVINLNRFLWHGADATEDQNKHWFVMARVTGEQSGGSELKRRKLPQANLSRNDIQLSGNTAAPDGGYKQITIDWRNVKQQLGLAANVRLTVELSLRFATQWQAGASPRVLNAIFLATRAEWQPRSAAELEATIRHEIGHKIGMVAPNPGVGDRPDGPDTYYKEQLHVGPHCSNGAHFDRKTWTGNPTCVMYGSDHPARPATFCAKCKPVIRKLDLGSDMDGFFYTLAEL
ncbi:MAG: hypothetical protein R3B70_40205 [Polyangiaceae bacterium]